MFLFVNLAVCTGHTGNVISLCFAVLQYKWTKGLHNNLDKITIDNSPKAAAHGCGGRLSVPHISDSSHFIQYKARI